MAFLEARLPECPGFGFTGGAEFYTNIHALRGGQTSRNGERDVAIHKYSAPYNAMPAPAFRLMKACHLATKGSLHGFRFKDYADFEADDVSLGLAPSGSTPVQLVKPYATFGGLGYTRTIRKPVSGTVFIRSNGVNKAVTVATTTGIITPVTPWTPGEALTADFEFDVPVYFANDYFPASIENKGGGVFLLYSSLDVIEDLNP